MKKVIIFILGGILMLGLFTGCVRSLLPFPCEVGTNGAGKKAVTNESALVSLTYCESGMRNQTEYAFLTGEDGAVFSFREGWSDGDPLTCPADDGLAEQIRALYLKYRAAEWDGYDKYLTKVKDGSGFTLTIGFADGQTLCVHGENCSPGGFREFRNELLALLEPYREKLTADGTAE